MSKSIENILKQLLESQESQVKAFDEKFATFAGENNTYTERMKKMEESLTEAMKKVLEMDNNIKEYHKHTGAKVEAMEAQYAKMFEKTENEGTKEDEKKHEKSEPESIKKQEEEMEDDEEKKNKQVKKDKKEHLKEDEDEMKDEKKLMAKEDCEDEDEKKASKMPSDKKLIVQGPPADAPVAEDEAEASNDLGGINKNQTVLAKPNQKRHKENPLGKPKNAEETLPETQASAETVETLASSESPASVSAAVAEVAEDSIDAKIEAIAKKFASLTALKPVALEEELNSTKATMAVEVKAKEEAVSKYKALEEKFEMLMSKVNTIEKSAKTIEEKAAQIVSNHGTEAVAISVDQVPVAETDLDIYKKFEALAGVEQRKFYLANKQIIERHASSVLRSKRS